MNLDYNMKIYSSKFYLSMLIVLACFKTITSIVRPSRYVMEKLIFYIKITHLESFKISFHHISKIAI